jgi:hypothetical protein
MASTTLLPQFLNTDKDPRYLEANEMIDALNVSTLSRRDGKSFVGRNAFGNRVVDSNYALPSGENVVLGSCTNVTSTTCYYFVWNSNESHRIVRFSISSGRAETLLQSSLLNFNRYSFIDARVIVDPLTNNDILYFVDDINRPRKLNVKRAIDGEYSSANNEMLSAIMQPPLLPPSIEMFVDKDFSQNNVYDRAFQFVYRFVYKDGEISVYSPISKASIDPLISDFYTGSADLHNVSANAIKVTCSYGNSFVERVEVAARSGNDGTWYNVFKKDNNPSQPNFEFVFYNNGNYSAVSLDEVNGNYDYVPIRARALEYIEDRIVYANVLDSYDNTDLDVHFGLEIEDALNTAKRVNGVITYPSVTALITYDLNSLISATSGDYVTIDIGFSYKINRNVGFPSVIGSISERLRFNLGSNDDIDSAAAFFVQEFNAKAFTSPSIVAAYNSGTKIFTVTVDPTGISQSIGTNLTRERVYTQLNALSGAGLASLKAGATHNFGFVYFDEYLQDGGVQLNENCSVYVPFFSERDTQFFGFSNKYGRSLAYALIKHKPPVWAKKWAVVYGRNATTREFTQYKVHRAYVADPASAAGVNALSKKYLYLSLNPLKGKDWSYRNQYPVTIDYNFVEGDRVRVIKRSIDAVGTLQPVFQYIDLKVVDFTFLEPDTTLNPLYPSTPLNPQQSDFRTGFFLVVEDPKIENWSWQDVFNDTSYWRGEGTLIEIYRPYKPEDNVPFYEIGEMFEVGDAGQETRYHKSNVLDQKDNPQYDINNVAFLGDALIMEVSGENYLTTLRAGDTFRGVGRTEVYRILEVIVDDANQKTIIILEVVTAGTAAQVGDKLELTEQRAILKINCGDVYFRTRMYLTTNTTNPANLIQTFVPDFCEDLAYSDFVQNARHTCIGRVHFFSENNNQTRRPASMFITQPYRPFMSFNGLSTIRAVNLQYRDYTSEYGLIQRLFKDGDVLFVVFESKTVRIGVGKRIIEAADGGTTLVLSQDLLSDISVYAGEYGVGNAPEASAILDGKLYIQDFRRGTYMRLSQDGFTPVSDYGVSRLSSVSDSRFFAVSNSRVLRLPVGADPNEKEIYFTRGGLVSARMQSSSRGLCRVFVPQLVTTFVVDPETSVVTSTGAFHTTYKISTNVPSVQSLSDIVDKGYVLVSEEGWYEGEDYEFSLEIMCDGGAILVDAVYNVISGVLSFNGLHDTDNGFTIESQLEVPPLTVAFNENNNKWVSRYSFAPLEGYQRLSHYLYSFKNGVLYIHDEVAQRCRYYGADFEHYYTVVASNPLEVQHYQDVSLNATVPYDVEVVTDLSQTDWQHTDFEKKESFWYKETLFDKSAASSAHILPIGDVEDITGDEHTIIGFDPSSAGVYVGDSVYANEVLIGTITAISGGVITIPSSIAIVGEYLYVKRPQVTSGDPMRGHYMRLKLQRQISTLAELFSVIVLKENSPFYHNKK